MSTETSQFPSGELRASDAERDLAIAELSEHFQTGRLTQDEFDERSGRALRGRTGRELSELFTDLPSGDQPGDAADQVGRGVPAGAWGSPLGVVAAIAVAAIAVASVLGGVGHAAVGHGGFGWLIPVFIVALVVRRIARRR